jgi:hypothetical protein
MIDNIIKKYETEINAAINTDYNYFYIQPYRNCTPPGYGVIFNGEQIALAKSLSELEQIKNTMLFFLCKGVKTCI